MKSIIINILIIGAFVIITGAIQVPTSWDSKPNTNQRTTTSEIPTQKPYVHDVSRNPLLVRHNNLERKDINSANLSATRRQWTPIIPQTLKPPKKFIAPPKKPIYYSKPLSNHVELPYGKSPPSQSAPAGYLIHKPLRPSQPLSYHPQQLFQPATIYNRSRDQPQVINYQQTQFQPSNFGSHPIQNQKFLYQPQLKPQRVEVPPLLSYFPQPTRAQKSTAPPLPYHPQLLFQPSNYPVEYSKPQYFDDFKPLEQLNNFQKQQLPRTTSTKASPPPLNKQQLLETRKADDNEHHELEDNEELQEDNEEIQEEEEEEEEEDVQNIEEEPAPVPLTPVYPGPGKWAQRGNIRRPNIKHEQYINEDEEENEEKPVNYNIFLDGQQRYQKQSDDFETNFEQFLKQQKAKQLAEKHEEHPHHRSTYKPIDPQPSQLEEVQEDKEDYEAEEEDEEDDEEFVPTKLYTQVRHSENTEHIPREYAPDPRLREVVKDSKVQIVYTEEGYEDSAYDHEGEEKDAEENEGYAEFDKQLKKEKEKPQDAEISESKYPEINIVELKPTQTTKKNVNSFHKTEETKTTEIKDNDDDLEISREIKLVSTPTNETKTTKFVTILPKFETTTNHPEMTTENKEVIHLRDITGEIISTINPAIDENYTQESMQAFTLPRKDTFQNILAPTIPGIDQSTITENRESIITFDDVLSTPNSNTKQGITEGNKEAMVQSTSFFDEIITTPLPTVSTVLHGLSPTLAPTSAMPYVEHKQLNTRRKRFAIDFPKIEVDTDFIDKINHNLPPPKPKENKYPYYNSPNLPPNSALRYAEDLNNIPAKEDDPMAFYHQADKITCAEVQTDVNPIPDRVEKAGEPKEKDENEENKDVELPNVPRLRNLGDKIDCFKAKYFGENPLDSPFFKEETVGPVQNIFDPQVFVNDNLKKEHRNHLDIVGYFDNGLYKENKYPEEYKFEKKPIAVEEEKVEKQSQQKSVHSQPEESQNIEQNAENTTANTQLDNSSNEIPTDVEIVNIEELKANLATTTTPVSILTTPKYSINLQPKHIYDQIKLLNYLPTDTAKNQPIPVLLMEDPKKTEIQDQGPIIIAKVDPIDLIQTEIPVTSSVQPELEIQTKVENLESRQSRTLTDEVTTLKPNPNLTNQNLETTTIERNLNVEEQSPQSQPLIAKRRRYHNRRPPFQIFDINKFLPTSSPSVNNMISRFMLTSTSAPLRNEPIDYRGQLQSKDQLNVLADVINIIKNSSDTMTSASHHTANVKVSDKNPNHGLHKLNVHTRTIRPETNYNNFNNLNLYTSTIRPDSNYNKDLNLYPSTFRPDNSYNQMPHDLNAYSSTVRSDNHYNQDSNLYSSSIRPTTRGKHKYKYTEQELLNFDSMKTKRRRKLSTTSTTTTTTTTTTSTTTTTPPKLLEPESQATGVEDYDYVAEDVVLGLKPPSPNSYQTDYSSTILPAVTLTSDPKMSTKPLSTYQTIDIPPLLADFQPVNNFYVIGMKPPPEQLSVYRDFRKKKVKKRHQRFRRNAARLAYSEVVRDRSKPIDVDTSEVSVEEDDDYVPHRPKNYHYDEKLGRIVYDQTQKEESEEYIEVTEAPLPKPIPRRTVARPLPVQNDPNEPSYVDFIQKLKSNAAYQYIPDPTTEKDGTTTSTTTTTQKPQPTKPPEFLGILSKVRTDSNYKLIEDKDKKKTTTTTTTEEPEAVDESRTPENVTDITKKFQIFDINDFIPKVKSYTPRTSIDYSRYKTIERTNAKPTGATADASNRHTFSSRYNEETESLDNVNTSKVPLRDVRLQTEAVLSTPIASRGTTTRPQPQLEQQPNSKAVVTENLNSEPATTTKRPRRGKSRRRTTTTAAPSLATSSADSTINTSTIAPNNKRRRNYRRRPTRISTTGLPSLDDESDDTTKIVHKRSQETAGDAKAFEPITKPSQNRKIDPNRINSYYRGVHPFPLKGDEQKANEKTETKNVTTDQNENSRGTHKYEPEATEERQPSPINVDLEGAKESRQVTKEFVQNDEKEDEDEDYEEDEDDDSEVDKEVINMDIKKVNQQTANGEKQAEIEQVNKKDIPKDVKVFKKFDETKKHGGNYRREQEGDVEGTEKVGTKIPDGTEQSRILKDEVKIIKEYDKDKKHGGNYRSEEDIKEKEPEAPIAVDYRKKDLKVDSVLPMKKDVEVIKEYDKNKKHGGNYRRLEDEKLEVADKDKAETRLEDVKIIKDYDKNKKHGGNYRHLEEEKFVVAGKDNSETRLEDVKIIKDYDKNRKHGGNYKDGDEPEKEDIKVLKENTEKDARKLDDVQVFKQFDENKKHGGNYRREKDIDVTEEDVQESNSKKVARRIDNSGTTKNRENVEVFLKHNENDEHGGNYKRKEETVDETKVKTDTNPIILNTDPALPNNVNKLKEIDYEYEDDDEEYDDEDDDEDEEVEANRRVDVVEKNEELPKIIKDPSKRLYFYAAI